MRVCRVLQRPRAVICLGAWAAAASSSPGSVPARAGTWKARRVRTHRATLCAVTRAPAQPDTPSQLDFSTRSVTVDGYEVVARLLGEGEQAFVLVHGLGMSSYYFRPLARLLAAHGRVLVLNLPGFGPTKDPDAGLRIGQFARVARLAAQELGAGSGAVWVGHSMGTQVVVEAVRQDPSLADRVVLLAPVVNDAEGGLGVVVRRFCQAAVHEPPRSMLATGYSLLRAGPWYMAEILPALLRYQLAEHLGELDCESVLVGGQKDALTPVSWLKRLAASGRRCSYHVVAGASHQMMHSHPQQTAQLLLGR